MAKLKESSMRLRYFSSYLGIVFCACMLIGLLVLSRAINEINEASRIDYQEKMALAADELQMQQEILENISYRVKSSAIYRPFFASRNPYYEIEIVEDIAKFKDYSPLIDLYYCVQRETDSVFSASGKLTIAQFEHYRLGNSEGWINALFSGECFQILPHPTDPGMLLAALTFRVQTDGRRDIPDTALIFFISRDTLAGRLERISSLDTAMLTIYWKDVLLMGDDGADSDADAISVASEDGHYRIYSAVEPTRMYARMNDFRYYFIALLFVATAVLLAVTAFVAHRGYQPLDRLLARLNIPHNASAEDMETAVKELQENNRYSMEQLQSRLIDIARERRKIAQQLLLAKLSGTHNAQMDSLLFEAGIALNHPLFCVVLVHLKGGGKQAEAVSAIARSLSDDTLNIYPAGVYQAQYDILLLNFEERDQLDEVCAILLESLEAEEKEALLSIGEICEDIGHLPLSFVSAIMRRETEMETETRQYADREAGWYDDRQIRLMMQALREGNSIKAQTCLTEAMNMLDEKYPSLLLQRCIWADIGNQLFRTAKSMDIQLDPKRLQMLMMSVDTHSFRQQLSQMLDWVAAAATQRSAQESRQTERAVIAYIEERFFLPQFTMAEVAAQFELSERTIGNIVRHATGMTYKEFIIKLRMERAKMLLTQGGYNVSQTSESVGYNNIPYFIKTFRTYTGYTPGEYKKLFDKQEEG